MTLAKWSYTKEEWKIFRKWKVKQKGIFLYLLSFLSFPANKKAPEITISGDRVWFNDLHEPFQNSSRRFMDIHIREAEKLNILEISYEQENKTKGINVLIPKGKLKEALEVQDRLIVDWVSIG
jgi:hypothetical protein